MMVVHPVQLCDVLMRLLPERNRFYIKISETFLRRVDHKFLSFNGEELGVQPLRDTVPRQRQSSVSVLHIIGILKFDNSTVWFNQSLIGKDFVDLIVSVRMRATKIISLTNRLLKLERIDHRGCNVTCEDGLNFFVHAFDDEVHSVEHLHHHHPFSSNSNVLVDKIHHHSWTQDCDFGADLTDFLLTNVLCPQSS